MGKRGGVEVGGVGAVVLPLFEAIEVGLGRFFGEDYGFRGGCLVLGYSRDSAAKEEEEKKASTLHSPNEKKLLLRHNSNVHKGAAQLAG